METTSEHHDSPEKAHFNVGRFIGKTAVAAAVGFAGGNMLANGVAYVVNHNSGKYPQLSAEASKNASKALGVDVSIKCEDTDSSLVGKLSTHGEFSLEGYVIPYRILDTDIRFESSVIHLDTPICNEIAGMNPNVPPDATQALALFVVDHERMHTKGVYNEAAADCYALQDLPLRLMNDGYDKEAINQLQPEVYSFINGQPPQYRSIECVPNGKFDLTPNSDASDIWLPRSVS